MNKQNIESVVIVGGGSAGWMTAAMLAKTMGKQLNITLIESDQIGTVGVGEATIPPIQLFNNVLGLNESEFLKATQGTFKLGIQFENWGKLGDSYMHAFGDIGRDLGPISFHQYFLRAKQEGLSQDFWRYSLNYQAAKQNKFAKLDKIQGTPLGGLVYAYHFDATAYAAMLSRYAQQGGVKRVEGKVTKVNVSPANGHIESVQLESGENIYGELFIDCSGFRGLLIEEALHTGYDDWRQWLPCNRAWAVQSENNGELRPYTRSIAHEAGWQWQIPLQHRTGNGHVFSSKHISEEQARDTLLANLPGAAIGEPRLIKFTTGKRKKAWNKNCIALGLSSGFLEPLESTSLHLIQSSVVRLIKTFPSQEFFQADIDEFNRQFDIEFERIRDFIILHYYVNQRTDSSFWQQCQNMDIPASLRHKIDLFSSQGRVFRQQDELFSEAAWQQVMLGQNLTPAQYHSITDQLSAGQLKEFLDNLETIIGKTAAGLPGHVEFIQRYARSNT